MLGFERITDCRSLKGTAMETQGPAPGAPFESPGPLSQFLLSEPTTKWLSFSYFGVILKTEMFFSFGDSSGGDSSTATN